MALQFNANNRVFAPELNNLAFQLQNAVKTGCAVTQHSPLNMSVDVASGEIFFNATKVVVSGVSGLAIAASDPSFNRYDLVLINSAGTPSVVTGTPGATPLAPTYTPTTHFCLARVLVPNTSTTVTNANIIDERIISPGTGGGGVIITGANQSGCSNGDAVRFNGTNFVPAQANTATNSKVVGFINNISGGTGDVTLFGVIDFLSGLTAGSTYYLSDSSAGAITATRPTLPVKVGVAQSTTKLMVDIDPEFAVGGGKYTQAFTGTSITVTHNLNDSSPIVQVYDSGGELIYPSDITIASANSVTLTFATSTTGTCIVMSMIGTFTAYGTSSAYQQAFTTTTSVTVTHNLNQQYVGVYVYNASNQLIDPLSVTLNSATQCTVTFGVATTGNVVVVGGSNFTSATGAGSLIPTVHNSFDIGASLTRWANLWLQQNATIAGTLTVTGAAATGALTSTGDVIAGGDVKTSATGRLFLGVLTSDPGSPVTGQVWFNSTVSQFKGYNGTATVILG